MYMNYSMNKQFHNLNVKPMSIFSSYFFYYLKSSKTHTSAAPLLLEKGAEVKMKLQDLKLLIDKKKNIKSLLV